MKAPHIQEELIPDEFSERDGIVDEVNDTWYKVCVKCKNTGIKSPCTWRGRQ